MQGKNCFYIKKLPLYKCCTKIKAVYKFKTVFYPMKMYLINICFEKLS